MLYTCESVFPFGFRTSWLIFTATSCFKILETGNMAVARTSAVESALIDTQYKTTAMVYGDRSSKNLQTHDSLNFYFVKCKIFYGNNPKTIGTRHVKCYAGTSETHKHILCYMSFVSQPLQT
jgi:hypothetical protein